MASKAWDRPLDAEGLDRLVRLTQQGWPIKRLMPELRRNHRVISEAEKRLGIAKAWVQSPADPTPEQIAERAAAERARWSDAERRQRQVGLAADWRPTVVPASILRLATSCGPG